VTGHKTLVQGALVDGEVVGLGIRGLPVGTADGQQVRVPGGVPGDQGKFRIIHAGKNVTWARIETLHTPSPHRVEAPCPVLDRCGGCPWQAIDDSYQREQRLETLRAALGDNGQEANWHPWMHGAERTGYRTRALMMARHIGSRLHLGFFESGTNTLVPALPCVAQHPQVNQVMAKTRVILARNRIPTWRDETRPGLLRSVLYRLDPEAGDGLLTLVASQRDELFVKAADALVRIDGVCGVHLNLQPHVGGPAIGAETHHLRGARRQRVRYGDLTLEVGPTAFLQTHHALAQLLVTQVSSWLPDKMTHLLDLYAGVGVFGLALAHRADRVSAVDQHEGAIADLVRNARRLGHAHVRAIAGGLATELGGIIDQDVGGVVLDPPRSGCDPDVLEGLAGLPGRPILVYVSCQPKSLGRDVAHLTTHGGYRVTDVKPIEMFPHTPHLESVVRLARP